MKERYSSTYLHYIEDREIKLRIAVCDDEQHFRNSIIEILSEYKNEALHSLEFHELSCGKFLIDSEIYYDIIFLDYKMSGLNGLDTAKQLRKKGVSSKIIFLTNYPQFVFNAFEVKTFRFFEKPVSAEQLYKALDDYLERYKKEYPLTLKADQGAINIDVKEIEFIKASDNRCDITMFCNKLNCTASMSAVFELLPQENFCKVDKSFVVNLNNIRKYTTENIYFDSGNRAPIGRKYLKSFKEAFKNHVKRNVL